MEGNRPSLTQRWHEVLDSRGRPRPAYHPLLYRLGQSSAADIRELEERLDATLRELGITFELPTEERRNTWFCDLLPQIFLSEEWDLIVRGFQQRVKAFELLLKDVYAKREILKEGTLPIPLILGSPHFQRSAVGLRPSNDQYLHLSGLCLSRDVEGRLAIKNHYFSHASGLSYMIQNRRLLARVLPEIFQNRPVESIADVPTEILIRLRSVASRRDPAAVLLTPGLSSAVYSEHSFLARRMGIPLVQGGDLVVLDDALFLKTVSGLERVDVVYTRVADAWLDPLVFMRDSRFGVPGLIHCVRKGTAALVNSVGAQLADDRSLLHFSNTIVRFYLGEWPILPTIQTYWLGDLDQREMVLENLDRFQIRSLTGERFLTVTDNDSSIVELRSEIRRSPHMFVAQPANDTVGTLCVVDGRRAQRLEDFIVYGMRADHTFDVFPGALTRVSSLENGRTESEHGGGGKDTWVIREFSVSQAVESSFRRPALLPSRQVTSRVAEAFYWLGRYLERGLNVSKMIQVVETIEMEELNSAERKLYRPVWNQLLPPLENPGKPGRRSMTNVNERYRLMLDPADAGSVGSMVKMALSNANSLRETISPEAWAPLASLRGHFLRNRLREEPNESDARRVTRRLAEAVVALVPQFFATAQLSMLADDGWRFCELGQFLERAIDTANATRTIVLSLTQRIRGSHPLETKLSAFLRLVGSRDAYRRIYQTRSEAAPVLEFLWQNREFPRSVTHCLQRCTELLNASLSVSSPNAQGALNFLYDLLRKIRRLDWYAFFANVVNVEEAETRVLQEEELLALVKTLSAATHDVHHVITDNFLNHQNIISDPEPTLF
ncbi:MAG: circularly permuted type 2 ATP-grasp protein [Chthoniobacterales bacterium]